MATMDASTGPAVAVAVAVVVVLVSTWLWSTVAQLVWRPYAVGRAFGRQGIRGPAYRLFVGSDGEKAAMLAATRGDVLDRRCHDIVPRVMPHYRAWMSRYGKVLVSWGGATPALCVGEYGMVRQILADRTGLYGKPDPGPALLALIGKGLVFIDGDDWARHRRVVHPAFTMDKLKMMTKTMAECAREVIRAWEVRAAESPAGERRVQVEVGQQFQELTADVISHTAFGSSYQDGKEVFLAQRELQAIAISTFNSVRFPGFQYIPTKRNMRRRQLEKKVRGMLMAMIRERQVAAGKEARDLLGLMLEANAACGSGGPTSMTLDEIIDECKTFFFAGHDTTSHLLTWAMFLLGTHPEWQERLREEVLRECGGGGGGDTEALPNGDALSKLKLMTMVLYETLRLYGPVSQIARKVTADADLGGVRVPKGTTAIIPVAILHRDVDVWGADAGEFNPLRFRDGVNRAATHAGALLTFSLGHRSCIGQDFAMMEAKATLAMVLRRFAFEVAPEYVHAPLDFLTLQPKCGLPVVLQLLD
ncbi:cytochrome P450 709B1-like [Oryza brachyantha]|uniref:cytochrome P450 709B1-like n=1 Tax=Oryza brachyantha TaxID=4533 RepID=UPI001ADB94DC|nr:cytochrome P450 709B1-like [Oryza brachyantha]